ncbi:MAG: SiaB family protein kinase [Bacteroidales bacterium]|nr:SiaB family protein kinase [Bacteroidales bacterium]
MQSETDNDFILHFTGKIRYDTIGILINELKGKVQFLGIKTSVYKKILLVMIESLENIMKHNADDVKWDNVDQQFPPRFYIQKKDKKYILGSSNLIEKNNIHRLESRLEHLNQLDNHGLKELYKSTITDGQFTHKGGAGLGFIEIAKISADKIRYTFEPVNHGLSYFTFTVTIE